MKSFKEIYSDTTKHNDDSDILDKISKLLANEVIEDFSDSGHLTDMKKEHRETESEIFKNSD
jgi:hypothetical protein